MNSTVKSSSEVETNSDCLATYSYDLIVTTEMVPCKPDHEDSQRWITRLVNQ